MEDFDSDPQDSWVPLGVAVTTEFCGERVQLAVEDLLLGLGEDVKREGLVQTPDRVTRFWFEWFHPQPVKFTVFDAEKNDEMVIQTAIPFWSFCEHHMLPFHGTACVGYLPDGKIVGLSKLARAVDFCSRGLQNQERITTRIADMLEAAIHPVGVGVVLRAEHLCMSMRGIKAPGAVTMTSCLRGQFRDDAMVRAEFLDLALGRG